MATVTTAWAISHFFGVGEIADAVLLVVGGVTLGFSCIEAGKEVVDFAITAKSATTDEDLERAARHFGRAVVLGPVPQGQAQGNERHAIRWTGNDPCWAGSPQWPLLLQTRCQSWLNSTKAGLFHQGNDEHVWRHRH